GVGLRTIRNRWHRIHDVVKADHGRRSALNYRYDEAHRRDRPRHERHVDYVLRNVADGDGALYDEATTHPHNDDGREPDEQDEHGAEGGFNECKVEGALSVRVALDPEGFALRGLARVRLDHADSAKRFLHAARQARVLLLEAVAARVYESRNQE